MILRKDFKAESEWVRLTDAVQKKIQEEKERKEIIGDSKSRLEHLEKMLTSLAVIYLGAASFLWTMIFKMSPGATLQYPIMYYGLANIVLLSVAFYYTHVFALFCGQVGFVVILELSAKEKKCPILIPPQLLRQNYTAAKEY